MKRLLPAVLLMCLAASCSNGDGPKREPVDAQKPMPQKARETQRRHTPDTASVKAT